MRYAERCSLACSPVTTSRGFCFFKMDMFYTLSEFYVERRQLENIKVEGELEGSFVMKDKLQKALQEKLRALHTEEAFNGLFDFNVAFKANTDESHLVQDQDCTAFGVAAPNQELLHGFALPSPSVVSHYHPTERQI
ncbi:hypothetical protein TNCV_2823721 [Trichonephila clavipes]|nr:hypothetical protein TNCV_2823721 [Trichonephila clavipes]